MKDKNTAIMKDKEQLNFQKVKSQKIKVLIFYSVNFKYILTEVV